MGNISDEALGLLSAIMRQAEISCDSNSDEQALEVKVLYPEWADIPEGETLKEGKRVNDEGVLYKVTTTHNKQSTWKPKDSATLFTPIDEAHKGTIEDPIPWVSGMVSEQGKYYIDEGITYLCIDSSGVGLYGQPKDLARYFEKVTE